MSYFQDVLNFCMRKVETAKEQNKFDVSIPLKEIQLCFPSNATGDEKIVTIENVMYALATFDYRVSMSFVKKSFVSSNGHSRGVVQQVTIEWK